MKSATSSTKQSNYPGMNRGMAERLGLGPGVRELKLGPTFTSNKSTAFHTLKYDFKPASVDVSKMATVDVGPNNTMTVTVPHLDGAGTPQTVFKGSQRPYSKECVLIYDRLTGEITLERLSSNIQVKKTRADTKSQTHLSAPTSVPNPSKTRPITPIEMKRSPTHGRSTSRTKVTSGKKREPTVQLHPKPQQQPSPMRMSPYHKKSPPHGQGSNNSPAAQRSTALSLGSLPMIGNDFEDFHVTPPPSLPPTLSKQIPTINERNFNANRSPTPTTLPSTSGDNVVGILTDSETSSSSSSSSDSESEPEKGSMPTITNGNLNGKTSSPLLNMPDNLLNDDLQLSESESDDD